MTKLLVSLLSLTLPFTACNKEKKQARKEKKIIENYIHDHGINAQSTESGLYYVIDAAGTGTQPNGSSDVTVAYKGYLTNSFVFDESPEAGITFNLGAVIKGWQEGIPLFKEGGSGKLIIPSALGYGSRKMGEIPANSVLVFEVKLIDVL